MAMYGSGLKNLKEEYDFFRPISFSSRQRKVQKNHDRSI